MKKILLFAALVATFMMATSLLTPISASAALFDGSKQAACDGIEQSDTGQGKCDSKTSNATVNNKLAAVINVISLVVGIAAVIMIMIGGLKYITSAGDPAKVGSAKDTILYAIIGIVIVFMAQFIVKFVLTKTTAPPPKSVPAAAKDAKDKIRDNLSF